MKNTGTKELVFKAGNKVFTVPADGKATLDPTGTTYTVTSGSTTIATIDYPSSASFTVKKGSKVTGAKFSSIVDMDDNEWSH